MPDDQVQFRSPTTGAVQAVPPEHWQEALDSGYQPTTHKVMYSPTGERGMVPNGQLRDYVKQGYQTTPKTQLEQEHERGTGVVGALRGLLPSDPTGGRSPFDPRFWYNPDTAGFNPTGPGTAYSDLTRPLPADLPTQVLGAGKTGGNTIYRGASLFSPVAGVSPEGMEEASGRGDTSNVATQAIAPIATTALGAGAKAATAFLPNASRAGAALQNIRSVAGQTPIDMSAPGNTALDIYTQSQRGAVLPTAVRKFINRAVDPNGAPMNFDEAKDFQSNISNLSANEKMNLKPNTARLVGQLNQDLKGSLTDAAETHGLGQQFQDAMKEYHNAMRLKGFNDAAIEYAIKTALAATGLYGAGKVYDLSKSF